VSINPFGDAAEQLSARFYAWERRGRGWDVYPYPVVLEPPFRPFERFVRIPVAPDDGRRPSRLLSVLSLGLAGRSSGAESQEGEEEPEPIPAPSPGRRVVELQLLLPADFDPGKEFGSLLRACASCAFPVSFELISRGGVISLQLACSPNDSGNLIRQLGSIARDAAVLVREEFLAVTWEAIEGTHLIADLGLSEEFMRPLCLDGFVCDPLVQVVDALASAADDEVALVQAILTPARQRWAEHILRSLTNDEGKPFFAQHAELLAQARHKIASPLYACRLRLAAKARHRGRSRELVRTVLSAFSQFAAPPSGNHLIALNHDGWDEEAQEQDLLNRTNHRSGMLLSADELAGLIHLPRKETAATSLERARQRTKAAPAEAIGHELVLGENNHLGRSQVVSLSASQRSRHLYLIGGTGTGKSTLLLNLISQDIEAGRGLAVLDPHGDLADAILARIPVERVEDVVVVDPSDAEYPVGINILAAHSDLERILLASDLVALFRRQSTSWGDQMNSVFANAILAFLESSQGGTLLDLRRFLVEKEFRSAFLRTIHDPEVVFYWEKEFPLLKGNPQAPILTRLDTFLRPKPLRHMVGNRGTSLDFRALMDERKILVVKLPQGAIGEENAHLLGALIVSKLQQLALSRQDVEMQARPPFYLYLDEFQHFATPSMATLLSGVRKYGLGLALVHQNLAQLPVELVESVFTNAGTRICFRLGEQDARKLAEGFSFFEVHDLHNLDTGEAICRLGKAEADFNLTTYAEAVSRTCVAREAVIAASRRKYATPLSELVLNPPRLPAAEPKPTLSERPQVSVPAVVPPPAPPAYPKPAVPATPGRGGAQHKYLQTLIKRFGEDRGFRATIERTVLDGHGSVDVALERDSLRVAFEITITTPTAHEIQNLAKCLAAGFDVVGLVATDEKGRKRLRSAVHEALDEAQAERVHCLVAEEVPELLDQLGTPSPTTNTVAGYKVKVQFNAPASAERQGRLATVREIISRSLGRPPGG
jgi:Type IV secretion-system coupling protein DNA-binding domain